MDNFEASIAQVCPKSNDLADCVKVLRIGAAMGPRVSLIVSARDALMIARRLDVEKIAVADVEAPKPGDIVWGDIPHEHPKFWAVLSSCADAAKWVVLVTYIVVALNIIAAGVQP